MTEEEAKTKWCPFARAAWTFVDGTNAAVNRCAGGELATSCVGSRCMAWRWASDFNALNAAHPRHPDLRQIAQGYCGLAGQALSPTNVNNPFS